MSDTPEFINKLRTLPRTERQDALESFVVEQFKSTLLMTESEDLPPDESFFELGFTSLRIMEARERIEAGIGRPVSANVMFNSPTVESLVEHIATTVLTDVLAESAPAVQGRGTLWDDVAKAAYES